MGQRYDDAARAVSNVTAVLEGRAGHAGGEASVRARELAGADALAAHTKTTELPKRAAGERYEAVIQNSNVAGL